MTDRTDALTQFLSTTPWCDWSRSDLAGDASARRYERLHDPDAPGISVVVMDAPPERGEDVRPFVTIARHLTSIGLAAPDILAEDSAQGFLVIEDLGDALFARIAADNPASEQDLYGAAVDALLALHQHEPPENVARFDLPLTRDFIALPYGWYLPQATGHIPAKADTACDLLNAALSTFTADQSVLILRDFHAENLIWRADRSGVRRVGLLDFQDALAGHPAYDLVSLLEDARRDVAPATRDLSIERYIKGAACDPQAFSAAMAVLGAQRNLRILGVFSRLSLHFGKPHYVDLIPRVWNHLMRDLCHPALSPLRDQICADLPAPTPAHLEELKARCATLPMP